MTPIRPPAQAPGPGTIIDSRYRLANFLGTDGTTWSYAATHMGLSRNVTIEFLAHYEAREDKRRFRRGARVLGMLRHPNVVGVQDIGEHEGRPYVVLEYLGDQTFATHVNQYGPIARNSLVQVAQQLLSALSYIHERQLVHRNVSAQHLVPVKNWNGTEAVRLTGFSLAKGAGLPSLTDQYQQPHLVANLAHIAPELILDPDAADHRVDIYGAGCTVYQLLTGRNPFEGKTIAQLARAIQQQPMTPPHDHNESASPELSAVLGKALAKDPRDRYQTVEEFHSELIDGLQRHSTPTARPHA